MQRWFPHSNWVDVQNLSAKDGKESLAFWRKWGEFTITISHVFRVQLEGWGKTVWVLRVALCSQEKIRALWDWPQCVSSAPFSQSFSLSQVQLIGMQRPLGQAKKFTGHLSFLLSARQQKKTHKVKYVKISEKPKAFRRGKTAPNLDSFSHLKSLHSHCCHHTPTRLDNTKWFSHSSGRKLLLLPDGRNGSNQLVLKIMGKAFINTNSQEIFPCVLCPYESGRLLTTVHFITCIFTVDHLVTAAVVGDAASIFALELSCFAQGHCRAHRRFYK